VVRHGADVVAFPEAPGRRRVSGYGCSSTREHSHPGARPTPPSPPRTQTGLATLEWVRCPENLAIAGPSGAGKTHFVEALAHKVIDAGMRVSWFTLESLTAAIGRASVDDSIAKTVAGFTRSELIVIDDIGMLPAGQAAGEAFYRVVDAAHERRSVAITSNLRVRPPTTYLPDSTVRDRDGSGTAAGGNRLEITVLLGAAGLTVAVLAPGTVIWAG
jgi:IstB-like ATP binding protein